MGMIKTVGVLSAFVLLMACSTSPMQVAEPGSGPEANCAAKVAEEQKTCEAACPVAKGDEHFTVQHRMAQQHAQCVAACQTELEEKKASCAHRG